jgi:hypothetical protein
MTTRPEERGARMPSDPEEVHVAYGEPRRRSPGRPRQSVAEAATKSLIRSLASSLGRAIMRAIVGRR